MRCEIGLFSSPDIGVAVFRSRNDVVAIITKSYLDIFFFFAFFLLPKSSFNLKIGVYNTFVLKDETLVLHVEQSHSRIVCGNQDLFFSWRHARHDFNPCHLGSLFLVLFSKDGYLCVIFQALGFKKVTISIIRTSDYRLTVEGKADSRNVLESWCFVPECYTFFRYTPDPDTTIHRTRQKEAVILGMKLDGGDKV